MFLYDLIVTLTPVMQASWDAGFYQLPPQSAQQGYIEAYIHDRSSK